MAVEYTIHDIHVMRRGISVKVEYYDKLEGKRVLMRGKIYKVKIHEYWIEVVGYRLEDKSKGLITKRVDLMDYRNCKINGTRILGRVNKLIDKKMDYMEKEELRRLGKIWLCIISTVYE